MVIKNITSIEAAKTLQLTNNAKLIDVRSEGEWKNYGIPEYDSFRLLLLPWRIFPSMEINSDFQKSINSQIKDKKAALFFICKSGFRSLEAAEFVKSLGYLDCYNVIDGTEGNVSGKGWKYNNLPWQSF
ncbi:MAG: rhodanese-like domain-containing protein [Janthinobacterium lividum]